MLKYSRQLYSIDTRAKMFTPLGIVYMGRDARFDPSLQRGPSPPIPIAKARPEIAKAISNISAIVTQASRDYNAPTAQEVLENNKKVNLQILQQMQQQSELCRKDAAEGKPKYTDCGGLLPRP
jgi:hypothetical protein